MQARVLCIRCRPSWCKVVNVLQCFNRLMRQALQLVLRHRDSIICRDQVGPRSVPTRLHFLHCDNVSGANFSGLPWSACRCFAAGPSACCATRLMAFACKTPKYACVTSSATTCCAYRQSRSLARMRLSDCLYRRKRLAVEDGLRQAGADISE